VVYVTQEQVGKNLLPAAKYGEISVLLPSDFQVGFSAGQVTNHLDVKLSNFSDTDYLVLIGDPVIIGIATAVAAKWNKGKVKLLKWDKQEKMYYVVSINLYEKGDLDATKPTF
jgi:hypothetical protein